MTKQSRGTAPPVGYVWAPKLAEIEARALIPAAAVANRPMLAQLGGLRVHRRADHSLLKQFCALAESENLTRSVRAFARRWGLLQLCEHGLPAGHDGAGCVTQDTEDNYWEFARSLNALVKLGLDINAGQKSDISDWTTADRGLRGGTFPQMEAHIWQAVGANDPAYTTKTRNKLEALGKEVARLKKIRAPSASIEIADRRVKAVAAELKFAMGTTPDLDMARDQFQILMRRLVDVSGLTPRFHWDAEARSWAIDFDAEYRSSNLAAILAIQIMADTAGGALRKCRECPRWFRPKGRRVYCNRCSPKGKPRAAWRAASRRKRDLKRARFDFAVPLTQKEEKRAKIR